MKVEVFFRNFKNIHFIGVGGVSMSGLAAYCLTEGFAVSGSDKSMSDGLKRLKALGAKIFIGHRAANARGAELIVYSSAISDKNPELVYALKKGIPVLKRSELLGQILSLCRRSVAVSGSHGKTTATAMLAEVFIAAGLNPTVFLGGDRKTFGNFKSGGGEVAVAEACEYRRNFLDISPSVAVVLNIDNDHVDTFTDMADETAAFRGFVKDSLAVVNADDAYARKVFNSTTITFGIKNLSAYSAKYLSKSDCRAFTAYAYGKKLGRVRLKIAGEHNVYNALAVIAVANEFKIPFAVVKTTLENFDGVKRRNEYLGDFCGVPCYADYAHHPTEIAALLKDKTEKTLAVFQPHTYSRTAKLLEEFVLSLQKADGIIIYKTYPAREKFSASGDGKRLYLKISENFTGYVSYAGGYKSLVGQLKAHAKEFNKIIFIGAGDIYGIAKTRVVNGAKGARERTF